jgi:hypothetical protein
MSLIKYRDLHPPITGCNDARRVIRTPGYPAAARSRAMTLPRQNRTIMLRVIVVAFSFSIVFVGLLLLVGDWIACRSMS